jgi:hypothetical protein
MFCLSIQLLGVGERMPIWLLLQINSVKKIPKKNGVGYGAIIEHFRVVNPYKEDAQ